MLIFTQMTRMLDVLEQFLGYHGHIYLRLDGSTRVEQRQVSGAVTPELYGILLLCWSSATQSVGVNSISKEFSGYLVS